MKFNQLFMALLGIVAYQTSFAQIPPNTPEPMPKIALPVITTDDTPMTTTPQTHATPETDDLQQTLDRAILDKDEQIIAQLLPLYQSQPNPDPITLQYAKAVIFEKQGNLKGAIAIYRKILADNPELTPIRFELAKVLFDDKQNANAKAQFEKVKSDNPPAFVQELSDLFLTALRKRGKSTLNFSLNYLNDNNVNNATHDKNIADTPFVKSDSMLPQSAHGISYGLTAQKDVNVTGNHYLSLGNELFGKYYWDNHDYNDLINRTSAGYVYQDDKSRVAVLPFYEFRSYANQSYKDAWGVRTEYARWLNPKHQTSVAFEYADNCYQDYHSLDGDSYLLSLTHIWLTNPKRYVYAGADISQDNAAARHHAYHYKALRVGMGQEWQKGISSRVGLTFGRRDYQGTAIIGDIIPLTVVRSDDELGVSLSLWKRDWHIWGITPRLNYQYKKVDSNIPSMYSTHKNQVYLSFEKSF